MSRVTDRSIQSALEVELNTKQLLLQGCTDAPRTVSCAGMRLAQVVSCMTDPQLPSSLLPPPLHGGSGSSGSPSYPVRTQSPHLLHFFTPSLPHSLTPSLPHSLTPSLPRSLTPPTPTPDPPFTSIDTQHPHRIVAQALPLTCAPFLRLGPGRDPDRAGRDRCLGAGGHLPPHHPPKPQRLRTPAAGVALQQCGHDHTVTFGHSCY